MEPERHDEALADKVSSLATGWVGTETQRNGSSRGVILNLERGMQMLNMNQFI